MTTTRSWPFLLILLLFVAGRCLVPMDETDLFFNLRLGQLVLARHAVPRTNLLSFTYPDARDVNLAWLFQIILVLAYRLGGIAGTVLLKTAFVLATWALLFRVALRRGAHPAAAAAALALAAWAAEPRFVERPHLVTFLGLASLLLALERAEAGRPRLLLAMIPLALVWANGNSCFFLAPVVLTFYAAGAHLDRRSGDARRALLVAAGLVPFIFATPSGAHALGYIANHFRMPWLRPLQEYRTAGWPVDGPFFFVAAGLLIAVALRGRALRHALPAVALGCLGAFRIRFVAEFAILSGPILAVAFTELAPRASKLARPLPALVAACLLGLTIVPRVAAARRGERAFDIGTEAGLVPLEAIRFVDDHGLADRMYNDLEVGSYLTWHWRDRHQVFQDPRINGYPPEFHAVLKRDDLTRADWQTLMRRFGVTAALVTYPDLNPRAALFSPDRWALVYRDAEALVFAAREPQFQDLIASHELPLSFSFTRAEGVSLHPLSQRPLPSPVADCEWQRRLGDVLVETGDSSAARKAYGWALLRPGCLGSRESLARLALGDLALAAGDNQAAADAYAGVPEPRARTNRGLALLALGELAEAQRQLTASLTADPDQIEARLGLGFALKALGRRDEAAAAFAAFLAAAPHHPAASRARAEL
ncbi:MAG TPA: tetratricopeptide repeat protein, partial [Polyangia bacterium]|nr:tetratricopeptide repeat protein [Polyangia bacterium]